MKTLNSGFTKLNRVDLVDKANHIVSKLGMDPATVYFPEPYPAPVPSLGDLNIAIAALVEANAMDTSVAVTLLRKQLREPIQTMLKSLADYLMMVADGDVEMLIATGFDISKTPEHTHMPPGTPQNIRIHATGIDGGISLICQADPLADFYELETSTASAAGPWSPAGSFPGSRGIHAEGFPHGTDVYAHLRAVGTNGPGPWSDPAVVLVN